MIMGGAKRMGGGKRTRERALPKNSGPLQKSFWSAHSWIFVKENRATTREVFLPPSFSTPPWRPLNYRDMFVGNGGDILCVTLRAFGRQKSQTTELRGKELRP